MSSKSKIVGIGPLSPPITGPGLKNKYLLSGLRESGVEVEWINTLDMSPGTLFQLITKPYNGSQFIVSASTKVRFIASAIIYPRIRAERGAAILMPMGGQLHNEINRLPGPMKRLYKSLLSEYDTIFPETDQLKNGLEKILGEEATISTLPNLRPRPKSSPNCKRQSKSSINCVYVGRIKEEKGLDDSIEAVERCRDNGQNISFDIYGQFLPGDSYKQNFLDNCAQSESITYAGKIPDGKVIETMRNYDVFILPTYYEGEGFPGVLIEAYMAGCAVIATRWNSNPELVKNERTGLLYEARNVDELQHQITRLYNDTALLENMMAAAWERSEEYSVNLVSNQLLAHLRDLEWEL